MVMTMVMAICDDGDDEGDDECARAVLQAPFNSVEYSIIGDDSSPAFFNINPTTGSIFLSQPIANDPTDRYYVSSSQPAAM